MSINIKDIIARLTLLNSNKNKYTEDPISKENVEKLINIAIANHRAFFESLLKLAPKEFNELQLGYSNLITNKKAPIKEILTAYRSKLRGKALNIEKTHFLKSLIYANEKLTKELENIYKNLDMYITEDTLTLEEFKISNMSLLGVLRQSDILSHWSCYLWHYLCMVMTNTDTIIPKYRLVYLENYTPLVIELVNDICDEKLPIGFVEETKKLRKNLADANMYTSDGKLNAIIASMNSGNIKGFFNSLGVLLNILNIFRWPIELWDDYLYRKNLENIELKNWMEQHVALLRLELMKISPDDPKYYKLQKVIEAYDLKITEYAEKIAKYEEED
jgi:hypothetical protein